MSNFYHLKNLSSSFENYLKTIGDLEVNKGQARSKEIARVMKVKPSSVTNALQVLRDQGLIQYEPYGPITLTTQGKRIWIIIRQKYTTVKDFLTEVLKIDTDTAEQLACTVEHSISTEVTEKLLLLRRFLTEEQGPGKETLVRLHSFFETEEADGDKTLSPEIPMFLLSSLKPGEKATIHRVNGKPAIRKKLMDMGISKGQEIVVERVAPLGDPVEITVRGYRLSLRRSEAELIIVK